jgi:hypothetical protein
MPTTLSATHERRSFALMTWIALAVVVAGFAPSYYLAPLLHVTTFPSGQPVESTLPPIVVVHGALFSVWMAIFAAQSSLVATGHVRAHRRLGTAAALLIPAVAVVGWLTAIRGARDGWNPGGPYADALAFLIVGLTDIVVFAALATAGVYFRRHIAVHRRLMLYAVIGGLLWPAITRLWFIAPHPLPMFGLMAVLLVVPAIHDFRLRASARWITVALALGNIVKFPLRTILARTEAWHALAAWIIR